MSILWHIRLLGLLVILRALNVGLSLGTLWMSFSTFVVPAVNYVFRKEKKTLQYKCFYID
ncbi:hypothetical protein ACS0TY_020739 [Phlomoides rotata]